MSEMQNDTKITEAELMPPDAEESSTEVDSDQSPDEQGDVIEPLTLNPDNLPGENCQPLEKLLVASHSGTEFKLKRNGLYAVTNDKNGRKVDMFIASPIRIEAMARSPESDHWSRLISFTDPDGIVQTELVQMKDIGNCELINHLMKRGVVVGSSEGQKNKLQTYLQEVPPENAEKVRLVTRSGWQDDNSVYVFPNNHTIGDSDEKFMFMSKEKTGFETKGTIEEWIQHVAAPCRGNSRLVLSVSAAFAAPLLSLIGEENGGIHFHGTSSIGKSTALRAATSVCGNWDKYKKDWRSTDNALEMTAYSYNDALLPLDEINESDQKQIGKIAYMLGNGIGKSRMSSTILLRPTLKFRLLFMSSGEITFSDYMRQAGMTVKGGQEVRFVDLPADPGCDLGLFEDIHGYETPAIFAEMIKSNTGQYYGTPFPLFIEALIKHKDDAIKRTRQIQTDMIDRVVENKSNGQLVRVAKRFGLIAAGGVLASEYGLTGWDPEEVIVVCDACYKDWVIAKGRGSEQMEVDQLIDKVESFFFRYTESRFSPDRPFHENHAAGNMVRPVTNRAGFIKKIEQFGACYVVNKETFEEICTGYSPHDAARILVAKGYLIPGNDGKPSRTVRLAACGAKTVRMYIFPMSKFGTNDPPDSQQGVLQGLQ